MEECFLWGRIIEVDEGIGATTNVDCSIPYAF